MVAYTFRMPAGIPGDINRAGAGATVEPVVLTPQGSTGAFTAYGLPGVIDATTGRFRMLTATDTTVYAFLARPYPANSTQDPLGTSSVPTPVQGYVTGSAMRRGYMTVQLAGTAPAVKGQPVYVWTAASGSGHVQGTIEAAASSGNTVQANAFFTGPADASGNVEIEFNI